MSCILCAANAVLRCTKCNTGTCELCGDLVLDGWECILCLAADGPRAEHLRALLETTLIELPAAPS